MMSSRTCHLLVAATVMSGLLAGGNVDRAFVAMPAWQHVGAPAWAAFSRQADLGNGLVLYPIEAIGGFLLILAATVSLHLDRAARGHVALPLYAAALLAAAGLVCTLKAAPIMLSISRSDEPAALQQALDGFHFWGNIRGLFQGLAFFATVWALAVKVSRPDENGS